jgi:hypothetical protein
MERKVGNIHVWSLDTIRGCSPPLLGCRVVASLRPDPDGVLLVLQNSSNVVGTKDYGGV